MSINIPSGIPNNHPIKYPIQPPLRILSIILIALGIYSYY